MPPFHFHRSFFIRVTIAVAVLALVLGSLPSWSVLAGSGPSSTGVNALAQLGDTETPTNTATTVPETATNTAVPATSTPGTCEGGADGFPECNPQIDAEVNLSVDCASPNLDGTYTVGGVMSVTNQSEHSQSIRLTEVVGPTLDSETFFLGQVIPNGATLSYSYTSIFFTGGNPDAQFFISVSVLFESTEGRGTVREPRGDVEEFYLDAKDPCFAAPPTSTATATSTETATSTATSDVATSTSTPGACPDGVDGFPECNPQIDAEVNISKGCITENTDGSYTVLGTIGVTNQSEHDQDIRITIATASLLPGTADLSAIETFFEGKEILDDGTLSYPFEIVVNDIPGSQQTLSLSVIFESVQGRGTVREPREDAEEFVLKAQDECATATPTSTSTVAAVTETATETVAAVTETATATETQPVAGVTEDPGAEETATATETDPVAGVTEDPGTDETETTDTVTDLPVTGIGSQDDGIRLFNIAGMLLGLLALMSLMVAIRLRQAPVVRRSK